MSEKKSNLTPYYQDDYCTIYHGDCRDVLPKLDKVDLMVTDPPYGIGEAAGKNKSRGKLAVSVDYGNASWDNKRIDQGLLNLVLGVAPLCILWGGNYYADLLPASAAWFVWDKHITGDFADCELAWTNLKGTLRKIDWLWNGCMKKHPEERFHPTQKPLAVMKFCIQQAEIKNKKTMNTILDPFMGSGTTLVAAKNLGRKAIGIELEKKYCDITVKRLRQETLGI